MVEGFFPNFLINVSEKINDNFKVESVIETKHVRKVMNIENDDRSSIIFISRALKVLKNKKFLKLVRKNGVKRYKVLDKIPL